MKKFVFSFIFIIVIAFFGVSYAESTYSGEMYIETPTENHVYGKNNASIYIQGWAVSTDSNAVLRLYVNDTYIKSIYKRTSRDDVNKVVSYKYGGTNITPNAGFDTTLDISGYEPGDYKVTIYQVSRDEKVICSSTRTIRIAKPNYNGTMYIESPGNYQTYDTSSNNSVYIQGWAVSTDSNTDLRLYVNDIYIKSIYKRTSREDVNKVVSYKYGGTDTTPNAGFDTTLDISGYRAGEYKITIYQVSRYEQVISQETRIIRVTNPKYNGTMNIESIHNNQVIILHNTKSIPISGWAVSSDPGATLRLYVNDIYMGNIWNRKSRGDVDSIVSPNYGGTANTPNAGFETSLDISSYKGGIYNITIYQISRYEDIISAKNVTIMIDDTTTWGIDVSHYNGNIDWATVKNNGVNFAILKIGEYWESRGSVMPDSHFEEYYNACKSLGIAVGGYFYSYAFDSNEAVHEAEACYSLIAGKSFEMPIFLDMEDKSVTNAVNSGRTNVENLTNAVITFCDIMNSRGYQSGIYSYRNFFYSYLNMSQLERYNIWLAHYVNATDYTGKFDMWQYTSGGSVPGISGSVDLNWCFKRFY